MSGYFIKMYVLYIFVCVLYNKMLQKTSLQVSWKDDEGGQSLETGKEIKMVTIIQVREESLSGVLGNRTETENGDRELLRSEVLEKKKKKRLGPRDPLEMETKGKASVEIDCKIFYVSSLRNWVIGGENTKKSRQCSF